jgi:Ser/Thr protein kinase RdoA (MazF antagonist)
MTDTSVLPAFSNDEAFRIVRDLYGIEGRIKSLDGERDLNYLVTGDSGRFVFKIAHRDETYGMLECQHHALKRLAVDQVMPGSTSSVESIDARVIEVITSVAGINHYCRILHYVEGRLLSSVIPHTPELLKDLGGILARIDNSLQDFSHEVLGRPFIWNMVDALDTLERFKPLLETDRQRELVDSFENLFRDNVLRSDERLRRAVIHNDANDNNVLVAGDEPGDLTISSIIDFGDMVYSWLAVEPAVAAAYAMMGKEHPLEAATAIIQGYHESLPLRESEIKVEFSLICMRLCMSVCICAHQKSIVPDNEYLKISEKPAWELLEKLANVSSKTASQMFLEACDMKP